MNKLDMSGLGKLMRVARTHKGMTQEQLAHKANISKAQVSRLESGNTGYKIQTVQNILRILECKTFSMELQFADEETMIIPFI